MRLLLYTTLSFLLLISLPSSLSARAVEGILLPDKDVLVSSPVENVIMEVDVEEGESVAQDQLLAVLDQRTQQLQVALWEKRLELLQVAFESAQNLGRDNIVSREETLTAEIERDLARIQLDLAKAALDDTELRAGLEGIILEVFKEPGEMVRRGEEMFRIVNTETVFVQLFLPADEAIRLNLDQSLTVNFPDSSPIPTIQASVHFIDPSVDPNSGFQRIRLKIPNPGNQLKAGLRCTVLLP